MDVFVDVETPSVAAATSSSSGEDDDSQYSPDLMSSGIKFDVDEIEHGPFDCDNVGGTIKIDCIVRKNSFLKILFIVRFTYRTLS